MPNFTGSASAIRANGYSIRCHASFYVGELVYSTDITAIAGTPVIALVVSSAEPTYDHEDILAGYRVDIFTSGGDFKGRARVRFGHENTDTVIHIRETSAASIDFAVGDLVKVYNDLRLADKLVTANEWFNPDDTGFTDQGSNPPPLARSGGHWAGRVDDGQTYATIQMVGSTSDVVDPDSTPGNVSHLWTLPSGVAFQSGSADTDADPIIEADVGQHLILHTVTDDDNSKTITQAVVVMVESASAPTHRVVVTGYTGKPEDGFNWSAQVVSGNVDTATIPDGCLCVLWGRERVNNAWQSIRNNSDGREHILAVGYVRRERIRRSSNGVNVLEFEFISPLSRLREITAYSKVMEENSSPDSWLEVKTLGVKRAIIQLLQFYTTLIESGFDFLIDDDFMDYRYPAFYLQRSTVSGMLDELATGQDARVTCDRTGQFLLATHPAFIPLADRSGATTVWALTAADVLDVDVNVDHYPAVELYKTSGFSGGASGNAPLFSLYPGEAPGIGAQTPTRDRLIVDDQDDLNERTGRYGALTDRVLVDSDGKRHPAAELVLTLRGSYNFFDFRNEYVTLTDDYGRRPFSTARFYPTDVNVEYGVNGAAQTRVTLMQETHAPAGDTFIPPEQTAPPYTPIIYTPPNYVTPPYTGRVPQYTSDQLPATIVALAAASAQFGYAAWGGGSPSWSENSTGLGAGYGLWLVADPYDYRRYFALMSDGLYRNDNPKGGSSWSLVADNAAIFGDAARIGKYMEMSINRKGYIAICTGTNTFVYSTDYGASWNVVSINGAANSYGTSVTDTAGCKFSITGFNNGSTGRIYAMVFSSNFFKWRCWRSEDWGATWTVVSAEVDLWGDKGVGVIAPYRRVGGSPDNINDGSQEVFQQSGNGHSSNGGRLGGSVTAGATWSTVYSAGADGIKVPAGSYIGRPIHTFTYDSDYVAGATLKTGAAAFQGGIYTSKDGGSTLFANPELYSAAAHYICLNGSPVHREFLVAWARNSGNTVDKRIYWTDDLGATWSYFAPPTFFTGDEFCANVQIDISDLIAPA